jgi:hypothetical protein
MRKRNREQIKAEAKRESTMKPYSPTSNIIVLAMGANNCEPKEITPLQNEKNRRDKSGRKRKTAET